MSSKALSTLLFPDPERPVRITSWRVSRRTGCFTARCRSVFHPALVSAGYAHVFAIFCYGAASDVNAGVVEFLGYLVVGERLRTVFFFDHFLDQALEREQRHAAAHAQAPGQENDRRRRRYEAAHRRPNSQETRRRRHSRHSPHRSKISRRHAHTQHSPAPGEKLSGSAL